MFSKSGTPSDGALRAAELLLEARQHERFGRLREAMDCYVAAIAEAAYCGAAVAQAVGLRRLGVLHHRRNETAAARESCQSSIELAMRAGESSIAAEAMIALGNIELAHRNVAAARDTYHQALAALGDDSHELRARIEHYLAILGSAPAERDPAPAGDPAPAHAA